MNNKLTIALPSKGSLGQNSINFLNECGIKINRQSQRQYTGQVKNYKQIEILFQRAEDIPKKINDGTASLGITGLDIVKEYQETYSNTTIIIPKLGYGKADLVVAVPANWIHISSIYDLANLAAKRKLQTKPNTLNIASKFNTLTKNFLHKHSIYNYKIINASGVLEITPKIKLADIIVDLTSSGDTIRDNQLKTITDGIILKSQACLIGKMKQTNKLSKEIIDKIKSHIRAKNYIRIMTNIKYSKEKEIEKELKSSLAKYNIEINTFNIAKSLSLSTDSKILVNITLVVKKKDIYNTVNCLRNFSASEIALSKIDYLFLNKP